MENKTLKTSEETQQYDSSRELVLNAYEFSSGIPPTEKIDSILEFYDSNMLNEKDVIYMIKKHLTIDELHEVDPVKIRDLVLKFYGDNKIDAETTIDCLNNWIDANIYNRKTNSGYGRSKYTDEDALELNLEISKTVREIIKKEEPENNKKYYEQYATEFETIMRFVSNYKPLNIYRKENSKIYFENITKAIEIANEIKEEYIKNTDITIAIDTSNPEAFSDIKFTEINKYTAVELKDIYAEEKIRVAEIIIKKDMKPELFDKLIFEPNPEYYLGDTKHSDLTKTLCDAITMLYDPETDIENPILDKAYELLVISNPIKAIEMSLNGLINDNLSDKIKDQLYRGYQFAIAHICSQYPREVTKKEISLKNIKENIKEGIYSYEIYSMYDKENPIDLTENKALEIIHQLNEQYAKPILRMAYNATSELDGKYDVTNGAINIMVHCGQNELKEYKYDLTQKQ